MFLAGLETVTNAKEFNTFDLCV